MSAIDTKATLAEIINEHPALARELELRALDYCCGGGRTLEQACAEAGLDAQATAAELSSLSDGEPAPWMGLRPAELVDHLESTHHVYLRGELPRLAALVEKVEGVHRERHPELTPLKHRYDELRADLEPHLEKEEMVLFPMIRELSAAGDSGGDVPEFHCGSLSNPISVMNYEHDRAGALFAEIRRLSSDYTVPDDGCASFGALYAGLEQLEADTHLHIHKENNVLFPAVLEMDAGGSPSR